MTAEQIIGLLLALVLMLVGLAGSILPGLPSAVTFNYRYMRGKGFFDQTRRERRAYPAVDL